MRAPATAIVTRLGGTDLMIEVAAECDDDMERFWCSAARPSWLLLFAEAAGVETTALVGAACDCLRVAARELPSESAVHAIVDATEAWLSGANEIDQAPLRAGLKAAMSMTAARIRALNPLEQGSAAELVTRQNSLQIGALRLIESWTSRNAAHSVAVMASTAMRGWDEDPDVRIAPLLVARIREHISYESFMAALARTHPELGDGGGGMMPIDAEVVAQWRRDTLARNLERLRVDAERGITPSQVTLAITLLEGLDGAPVDHHEAFRWMSTAAAKGASRALWNLGTMYRDGLGTAIDLVRAEECFARAAEKGEWAAYIELARLLANRGDAAGATQWYATALKDRDRVNAPDEIAEAERFLAGESRRGTSER